MKQLIIPLGLLTLTACDPVQQDAKNICKELEANQNYTFTANQMTQKSCTCTLAETRKALGDSDWQKFMVLINGGDPFAEAAAGPDGEVQTPPALTRIETASSAAIQVCAADK